MSGVLGFIFIVLCWLIQPIIIWGLWDNTLTALFGVRDISFGEAILVWLICAALFKSSVGKGS